MRALISLPIAALLVGALAGPVSADSAGSAAPASVNSATAAALEFTSKSWECTKPEGKKFTVTVDSEQERWTLLRYNNPCDHGWTVTVLYRNSGGAEFGYSFPVAKNSKGIKSLKPRADWIIKLDARK
ncbi:hypothetical protein OHR68_01500 [Spirillospora sp. NBC_00431]